MTQRKRHILEYKAPWQLMTETIVYDGADFGYVGKSVSIYPYEGYVPFTKLSVYPLEYHQRKDEIMKKMVARGLKYVSLRGVHHQEYDGIVKGLSPFRQQTYDDEENYFPLE
jgi:hypothetical protein